MFFLKKKLFLVVWFLVISPNAFAQINIHRLLASGVEDAQNYTENYFSPGMEALAYSLTQGWFSSASSKKLGQFEFSLIGNLSNIKDHQKQFQLNTSDYNFLQFTSGSTTQNVANVLSENNPEIPISAVFLGSNGQPQSVTFNLPQGVLEESATSFITLAPQLSVGFIAGLEFKARYLPKINTKDATTEFFGFGVQHELSRWFPILKSLPLQVGIGVNYTHLVSDVKLGDTPIVDANGGVFHNELKAWTYNAIISKKIVFVQIYAGVSYLDAEANYGLRGAFNINQGVLAGAVLENPYAVSSVYQGWRSTIGMRINLALLKLNIDYNIQEYNTISAGISVGI